MFIKKEEPFDDLERHKANRVFPEALPGLAGRAVMLFRPMAMSDCGVQAVLDGAALTYSMWEGYLEAGRFVRSPEVAGRPRHPLAPPPHLRPRLGG